MKRGQAALEFLTTYGWAFLVILVMIGALAYFGVLNPKNFLPSRCTFSPEIDCVEMRMTAAGAANNLVFRFRNNVGSTANFTANATYIGGLNPVAVCNVTPAQLQPGRVGETNCTFAGLPVGDKAKFEITFNFRKTDGNYWNPIKGEIYGSVN